MLRLAGSAPNADMNESTDMEGCERGPRRERSASALKDSHLCYLTRDRFLHLKREFPNELKRVEKAAR